MAHPIASRPSPKQAEQIFVRFGQEALAVDTPVDLGRTLAQTETPWGQAGERRGQPNCRSTAKSCTFISRNAAGQPSPDICAGCWGGKTSPISDIAVRLPNSGIWRRKRWTIIWRSAVTSPTNFFWRSSALLQNISRSFGSRLSFSFHITGMWLGGRHIRFINRRQQ